MQVNAMADHDIDGRLQDRIVIQRGSKRVEDINSIGVISQDSDPFP